MVTCAIALMLACTAPSARRFLQLREVVEPELARAAVTRGLLSDLSATELDAPDLPADRLRQLGELDSPDALERSELVADESEQLPRGVGVGCDSRLQHHVRFRHRESNRIRARDDRGLRDRGMLEQRALELERADPIVGRFEHVVGAT